MTPYEMLAPGLKTIVDEAFTQGFRVFVSNQEARTGDPIETAQLCLDLDGSFAQVGTWRLLGYTPLLTAPVEPEQSYDYAGQEELEAGDTLDSQIAALKAACLSDTVTLRYFGVTVPNYGKKCLLPSSANPDGFVELRADGSTHPVEFRVEGHDGLRTHDPHD